MTSWRDDLSISESASVREAVERAVFQAQGAAMRGDVGDGHVAVPLPHGGTVIARAQVWVEFRG